MTSPDEPSPYDLIEPPKAPRLPGTVVFRPTEYDAIDAAAAEVFMHALNCVRAFGDFHMAVSAAPGNEPFFRRLMLDPALREFPWAKTHLWQIDELAIDPDDPRRRGITVLDLLAEPSDIPRNQVHLIDLEAADPVAHYEKQLGEHLGWRNKGHDRIDYALLDLGGETHDDPHSYIEGSAALDVNGPLVALVENVRPARIAMTMRAINAARLVATFATGAARKGAIDAITARQHVFSRIEPLGGELRWYVDHAASKGIAT